MRPMGNPVFLDALVASKGLLHQEEEGPKMLFQETGFQGQHEAKKLQNEAQGHYNY